MSPDPRIQSPTIWEWDLNENSTRYEYPLAQPSPEVLHVQFSALATVNAFVALASFVLILAIIKSKDVRTRPFNLYVLFIALPDFIGSFSCFWTCVLSSPMRTYVSESMCGYQGFYLTFAFCANAWMNFVIARELHKMLKCSKQGRAYQAPTRQRVFYEAAVVYTYSFLWGLFATFHIPGGIPIRTGLYNGLACFPMEYDESSSFFFYLGFLPGILVIPCVYAMYVIVDIFWSKLLPPDGFPRKVTIFLLRIVGLYFVAWIPFLVLCSLGNTRPLDRWVFWAGAVISHFQGLINAIVIFYTSDDIREEMENIICCMQWRMEEDNRHTLWSGWSSFNRAYTEEVQDDVEMNRRQKRRAARNQISQEPALSIVGEDCEQKQVDEEVEEKKDEDNDEANDGDNEDEDVEEIQNSKETSVEETQIDGQGVDDDEMNVQNENGISESDESDVYSA